MPDYLLDTSIYSQALRRQPVLKALEHWQTLGDSRCKVSIASLAEVEFGLKLEGREELIKRYEKLL